MRHIDPRREGYDAVKSADKLFDVKFADEAKIYSRSVLKSLYYSRVVVYVLLVDSPARIPESTRF